MQDEVLAHRLGLIPLKVDPRKMEMKKRVTGGEGWSGMEGSESWHQPKRISYPTSMDDVTVKFTRTMTSPTATPSHSPSVSNVPATPPPAAYPPTLLNST